MKTFVIVKKLLAVAATLLAVMLVSGSAQATHFRYSTIYWEVPNPAQPNTVKFTIESAWRRDFPWGGALPTVGSTVTPGAMTIERLVPTPVATINSQNMNVVVNTVNAPENWLVGVTEFTYTFPPGAGTYRVGFSLCCRISTLLNGNNDVTANIHTQVVIDPANPVWKSPRATLVPVIYLAQNTPLTLPLPSIAGDGPSTFSFAPTGIAPGQSGLTTAFPPGMTLTSAGVVSWTPTTAGLYAVQFTATSPRGVKIPIDVVFAVVASLPGTHPVLTIDGSTTPLTIAGQPGVPVEFTLIGSDVDIDPGTGFANSVVTLGSGVLPAGATLNPSLPANGRSPFSSEFSWTPSQLQGGSHVIAFTATDNTGRQTLNSVTINVNANDEPIISCGPPLTVEASSSLGASATAEVTVEDPDGDELALAWTIDGVPALSQTVPEDSGAVQRSVSASLGLGTHSVVATVTDPQGESATCTTSVTVVDTTPPAMPTLDDVTVEATSPAGAMASWLTPPAQDVVSGALSLDCSPAAGSQFVLGSTQVTCTATDDYGNSATTSFDVNVIDTTSPVVTPPADITVEAQGPTTVVLFGASATDSVSGNLPVTCVPTSGDSFAVGSTTVTCTATDDAGNSGSATFTVSVVDTTPPVIIDLPLDQVLEATGPAGAVALFTSPTAVDLVDGPVSVSCNAVSGSTFPLGTTNVTCSTTDAHGNSTSAVFGILVADTTAPVISDVPANQLLEATGPGGAVAIYSGPNASDLVDGTVAVVCSRASGSTFPLGMTNVNCSATDAHGNSSAAGFAITVQDTTAPVITVPANVSAEATSMAGALVPYPAATAQDIVDGAVTVTCTPPSGAQFALGTTTVNCSATDAAGNAAGAAFTVTVADSTAPVITGVTPSLLTLTPPNHRFETVTVSIAWSDIDPGTTCSIVSVTSNELINAGGDGNTVNDWQITGPLSVSLRAERMGKGNGRVYTLGVRCADTAGNSSTSSTTVSVPR